MEVKETKEEISAADEKAIPSELLRPCLGPCFQTKSRTTASCNLGKHTLFRYNRTGRTNIDVELRRIITHETSSEIQTTSSFQLRLIYEPHPPSEQFISAHTAMRNESLTSGGRVSYKSTFAPFEKAWRLRTTTSVQGCRFSWADPAPSPEAISGVFQRERRPFWGSFTRHAVVWVDTTNTQLVAISLMSVEIFRWRHGQTEVTSVLLSNNFSLSS